MNLWSGEIGGVEIRVRRRRRAKIDKHVFEHSFTVTTNAHTGMPEKPASRMGKARSRSDISATGIGHETPMRESSNLTPPSLSGAYDAVCRYKRSLSHSMA